MPQEYIIIPTAHRIKHLSKIALIFFLVFIAKQTGIYSFPILFSGNDDDTANRLCKHYEDLIKEKQKLASNTSLNYCPRTNNDLGSSFLTVNIDADSKRLTVKTFNDKLVRDFFSDTNYFTESQLHLIAKVLLGLIPGLKVDKSQLTSAKTKIDMNRVGKFFFIENEQIWLLVPEYVECTLCIKLFIPKWLLNFYRQRNVYLASLDRLQNVENKDLQKAKNDFPSMLKSSHSIRFERIFDLGNQDVQQAKKSISYFYRKRKSFNLNLRVEEELLTERGNKSNLRFNRVELSSYYYYFLGKEMALAFGVLLNHQRLVYEDPNQMVEGREFILKSNFDNLMGIGTQTSYEYDLWRSRLSLRYFFSNLSRYSNLKAFRQLDVRWFNKFRLVDTRYASFGLYLESNIRDLHLFIKQNTSQKQLAFHRSQIFELSLGVDFSFSY